MLFPKTVLVVEINKKGQVNTMENEKIQIIGVDHGFAMMKHTHGVFPNGLNRLSGEATLTNNTLIIDGQSFKIGEGRMLMKDDKTSDEDYFILTVAAVCKELKARGLDNAEVILAVGLPFSRFGIERQRFHDYLMRDGVIRANLDSEDYEFTVKEVCVYPQCYAAVASRLTDMGPEALCVDIGSKTVDIIHIINHVPVESESTSWPEALIECMERIKNEVYRQTNRRVTETQIQMVIEKGDCPIPDECVDVIRNGLHRFVEGIEAKLKENGFESDIIPIFYVGGGAGVMRRFRSGNRKNVTYIEDIRANAIGYEYLCRCMRKRG